MSRGCQLMETVEAESALGRAVFTLWPDLWHCSEPSPPPLAVPERELSVNSQGLRVFLAGSYRPSHVGGNETALLHRGETAEDRQPLREGVSREEERVFLIPPRGDSSNTERRASGTRIIWRKGS